MGCFESKEAGDGEAEWMRPWGMFPSRFCIRLKVTGFAGDAFYYITYNPDDPEPAYIASVSLGLSGKIALHEGPDIETGQLLVSGKTNGMSGRKHEINWTDGSTTELRSVDLETFSYEVRDETYHWTRADADEVSGILGEQCAEAWKAVRDGDEQPLAVFGELPGFMYSNGYGRFAFLENGVPGTQGEGEHWANFTVTALLKVWQMRAIGDLSNAVGGTVG